VCGRLLELEGGRVRERPARSGQCGETT
jgi:hypothetical protein